MAVIFFEEKLVVPYHYYIVLVKRIWTMCTSGQSVTHCGTRQWVDVVLAHDLIRVLIVAIELLEMV